MPPQGEMLETITTAIVAFFGAQQMYLDQVPQLGHIPKLFRAMKHRNDAIPATAIQIVHQLSESEVRQDRHHLQDITTCTVNLAVKNTCI